MAKLSPIPQNHEIKELLFKWRNNPLIYKWCRQNDFIDWNAHSLWFENLGLDKSIKMYLICKDNGTPIGVCGITDIDLINQRAEFSLYIGPEYQGNGFSKTALRLLFDRVFKSYPINLIWGECFDGNIANKIFKDLGMNIDGIRRNFYFREGRHIDAYLYSITRGEFYDRDAFIDNCSTN